MLWSILHRMILGELVRVFALSLVGITGILLLAGIVAEATQQGIGPAQVLAIIPLLIPSTLPYTIPATTLFATCVVYGRLSHDNEILAIKASGVNVLKVVWPGIFLGLLMSAGTMGLYYSLIPRTQGLLRAVVISDVEEFLYAMLRRDFRIKHPRLNYEIYIKRVHGRKLIDPKFKRKSPKGNYDIIADAREADLRVDLANKQLLIHMRDGTVIGEDGIAYFEDRVWAVPLPENFLEQRPRKAREMTWQEIRKRLGELRQKEAQLAVEVAEASSQSGADVRQHLANLGEKRKALQIDIRLLVIEQHMRPALAFGCLCFVLLGCPVAIWFSKSDYLSSFITCFLPIVFLYYPLVLCGNNLAKAGKVPIGPSIWAANFVVCLFAVELYRRLLRH